MRITIVLPNANLSGGVRVVEVYARRLAARGHTLSIIHKPQPQLRLSRRIKSLLKGHGWPRRRASHVDDLPGVELIEVKHDGPLRPGDVPDADAILATWWTTAHWIMPLPASKGVKVNFLQHFEPLLEPHDKASAEAVWQMELAKLTISQWLVDKAAEYGDDEVELVHNSVDTTRFHAPARGKRSRPTVGLLFSNHEAKGCDVSFDALRRVREALPELRVLSFGSREPKGEFELVEGLELQVSPPQEAIRELYGSCDVWLCGSRAEGFHLPPLEAMACRCPVVSTRVGGSMDVIRPGENGYLYDVEDAAGLAGGVRRVLEMDEPRWRAMSDAAYATAHGYTWDDATDRFEAALKRIVARVRGGGGKGGLPVGGGNASAEASVEATDHRRDACATTSDHGRDACATDEDIRGEGFSNAVGSAGAAAA